VISGKSIMYNADTNVFLYYIMHIIYIQTYKITYKSMEKNRIKIYLVVL
jgi:hypothetical protein